MKKLLFILLTILAGCQTQEIEIDPASLGYSYFPLEEGRFVIYAIEETTYSITAEPVTSRYQVKEIVAGKYVDLANQEAYKIHRYVRFNAQDAWQQKPDSIWSAKRDANLATRTENNVTFVKLAFPARQNNIWDGNRFNQQGKEEYEMDAYKKPFQILETSYDNTVTVMQSNVDDLCNKNVRYEVYADDIGLIYKNIAVLAYKQVDNQCSADKEISNGRIYTQHLLEYGK